MNPRYLLAIVCLVFSTTLLAQGSCEIIAQEPDGEQYQVDIDGERKTLIAQTTFAALARDYRASLDANEALLRRCGDTLVDNDALLREYETAMAKVRELSEELLRLSAAHSALNERFVNSLASHTALLEEYDALVARYRRAATRGSTSFDTRVGLGINNSDISENWDVFLGVGVFQFDAWVYGNSDQQGLGIGLSF